MAEKDRVSNVDKRENFSKRQNSMYNPKNHKKPQFQKDKGEEDWSIETSNISKSKK